MSNQLPQQLGMASQAIYQIIAQGKLDQRWADWFNGSLIQRENNTDGYPRTNLTCKVKDQAHLMGILNQLNSLNL